MRPVRPLRRALVLLAAPLLLVACGDGGGGSAAADDRRPLVVVSTSLLADVVENLVGDLARVEPVVPAGTDSHTFAPAPDDVALLREADLLVVNGGGLEEGLLDAIEAAEEDGVAVHEMLSGVPDPLPTDEDAHAEEEGHDHGDVDPHFLTDPVRTAAAAEVLVGVLAEELEGVDGAALRAQAEDYLAELRAVDEEAEAVLATVPDEHRVLVTNHDAFSYFADRYRFELLGTVIPSTSTQAAAGAGQLQELVEVVRAAGVPAVFAEATAARTLAETLAEEVGDVEVATLHTESLGPEGSGADTYLGYLRTNARTVAQALGGTAG